LTRLEYLDAEHCGLVNITPLTSLANLRYLSLARNRLQHNDYARLPPEFSFFVFLEALDLSKTGLAFLRHIDGLKHLQCLHIEDNVLAHNAFPQHISTLPNLTALYADNCSLDDLRRLPDICPKLQRLHASKNKQLTDDRMPVFATMPHLEIVHLRGCSLTSMHCFKGCGHVRELDVSDNTLTRGGASDLSDTGPSMEVLHLGNCGIRDTTFLKDLIHLKRVDLRGNVLNAALPSYFMMLDSHAHRHATTAAATSPPHAQGGHTPGSLSNRSGLQRMYTGPPPPGSSVLTDVSGDDDADSNRGGAAFSRSSNTLLRTPHMGPSAASPSRYRVRQIHADPLAWT
jgi:hypothetical protein